MKIKTADGGSYSRRSSFGGDEKIRSTEIQAKKITNNHNGDTEKQKQSSTTSKTEKVTGRTITNRRERGGDEVIDISNKGRNKVAEQEERMLSSCTKKKL